MPLTDPVAQGQQQAVEKMPRARKHDHGQLLRPRPVEHAGQRHHIVLLTMQHQHALCERWGVGRFNLRHVETADGRAHQSEMLQGGAPMLQGQRTTRGDGGAEGKSGQRQGQRLALKPGLLRDLRNEVVEHGQQIGGLAHAVVKHSGRVAHAAKVGPYRQETELQPSAGQGLRHLIVERAAEQWMRVRHQRQPAGWPHGRIDRHFDRPRRALHQQLAGLRVHLHRPGLLIRVGRVREIGQTQALHHLATQQMALHDVIDVALIDIGVPDALGIDHADRPLLAAIEAPRPVDAHLARTRQPQRLDG